MKQYFNKTILSFILGALLLVVACSKKIDDAYSNPNATVRVPVESLLPGIIGNFLGSSSAAGSAYGMGGDGLNIGRYIQFWAANAAGNTFDQMSGALTTSDVMGSMWGAHYYGMGQNLERMVQWSIEEKKWDYAGVGYAIRSWGWLTMADQYNDIILRDAFNSSLQTFTYQGGEEVYDTVRATAFRALQFLNTTGDNASQANLAIGDAYLNNGDVNKWKKFVYAILARSYNHLTNKATYQPDSVIKYANLAMQTNDDNATLKFQGTPISGTMNYMGPTRANVGSIRQSSFIANLMSGANTTAFTGVSDPRAWYILRPNNNGTFKGVYINRGSAGTAANDLPQNFWGGPWAATATTADTGRYIFRNTAEFPVITASEVQFMKAEALLRKGDNANALIAYQNGISLNFDMLTTTYSANVPSARLITASTKANYLANPLVVPSSSNLTLTHIMLQKYIALYGWGMHETWVDMRRYHYVDLDPVTGKQVYADFIPPSGNDLHPNNATKLVYRTRPRYNSEYLYNIEALTKVGAINLDYHTYECWFSQK